MSSDLEPRIRELLRNLADQTTITLAGPSKTDDASGDDTLIDLERTGRAMRPARKRLRAAFGAAAAAVFTVAVAIVAQRGDDAATTVDEAPAPARQNRWSAFVSDATGGDDIYLLREGELPRRVVVPGPDTAREACPAFAPDGGRLMFGRATGDENDGFGDAELVIVAVADDGSVTPQTTIPLEGMHGLPCAIWAPDGRWVAFGGADADNAAIGGADGVWVVDTVTGEIRRLPGYHPNDLEWRPGTDELAITGNRPVNEIGDAPIDIYTVSTGEIRTVGDVQAANLTWSPNGTTIAFTHGENESDRGIWLVDADGTNERRLTQHTGVVMHGIGVVWSPRGDRIAYQRVCEQHPAVGYEREHPDDDLGAEVPRTCHEQHEVVLVTATSDDPATPSGTEAVIPPPQTDGPDGPSWWFPTSVTWTPDGTHLIYTAWTDGPGGGGVIAVPVDTSQPPVVLADEFGDNAYGGTPWVPIQMSGGTGPLA